MTRQELRAEGLRVLAGMPDAAIDARILLEEACGITTQDLLVGANEPVPADEEARYHSYLERRATREPLAMIIGHWSFMGLDFKVTRDTLIPEQDTECLVEIALSEHERIARRIREDGENRPVRFCDLCTGTGCILISALTLAGDATATGVGTDLSEAALAVARENGAAHHLNGRIRWLQGDLFAALSGLTEDERRFDLLLTNPPYIPTGVIPTLEPEVRTGEPYMALCGGGDGLDYYRRIAAEAGQYLAPGGSMVVETGFDEAPQVAELFRAQGFEGISIYKDLGGLERGIVIRTA